MSSVLSDALSLDIETVAAQTRRYMPQPYGIGTSDISLAMLSQGVMPMDSAPAWMRKKAEVMKRHGVPRWVAQKVGLAVREPFTEAMALGVAREPEILSAWIERLERDEWIREEERDIDPATVVWADKVLALPDEWSPLFDRFSPIVYRPDAWARTWSGDYVDISIKCARYGYGKPAWWNGIDEVPWYYAAQIDGGFACLRKSVRRAFFLVGCGWNRDEGDPRSDGPLLALPYWRADRNVDVVRDVARKAWAQVEPRIQRG